MERAGAPVMEAFVETLNSWKLLEEVNRFWALVLGFSLKFPQFGSHGVLLSMPVMVT